MFVGYTLGHTGDTYRMWDPKTGGIHVSRDVIWLQHMFYKVKDTANYVEVNVEPEQNKTHMTVEADENERIKS
jgi:hypothetical protein